MSKLKTAVWWVGLAVCIASPLVLAQGGATPADAKAKAKDQPKEQPKDQPGMDHAMDHSSMSIRLEDLKWQKTAPELGEKSSEIAILRVNPKTQATELVIRMPKNFHLPKHWHSANESTVILKGSFVMECEGKRDVLGPGGWNFLPSKMAHEAWTKPDEGAIVFISVDAAWDLNWVGGPPKPTDFVGGRKS